MKEDCEIIIGIDLGTTNCTVAYCHVKEPEVIHQFAIPQIMDLKVEGESFSLPSSLYFPLKEELDLDSKKTHCVGFYAKKRGSEIPNRLISSAKSWLCHSGIDRRSPFLPLLAEENQEKMSPLHAIAEILIHLKEAWDACMASYPFNKQRVLITVPASFDPSSRQLVQEAAEIAGYPEILLLEEPQAAFYAWLYHHTENWRSRLKVNDKILVVDIGGGTTDFTLIEACQEKGDLILKRIAAGAHLLLGGDNIDLSLAYFAKKKLEDQGHEILDWQLQSLIYSCRDAKEKFFAKDGPKSCTLFVQGRGAKLIGGSISIDLHKEEVFNLVLEGFFPIVSPEERSPPEKRSGIQQIGLPYVRDPRISCQLAQFLSGCGETESRSMDRFTLPTHVLFNGGTLKGEILTERVQSLLNFWAKALHQPNVESLPDPDLDYAVSKGAVYYGLSHLGKAIRIRGGTARSYYIGVEESMPAIPGLITPLNAVCVVPFGMEEGTEQELEGQEFALVLGEQATFRFFSRLAPLLSNNVAPTMGTLVKNWEKELTELHPVEAMLDKAEADGKTIRIKLKSCVNELGTLELWCIGENGRRWKLEFDLREVCQK